MAADNRQQAVLEVLKDNRGWMTCHEIDAVADWDNTVSSCLSTMAKRGQLDARPRIGEGCNEYRLTDSITPKQRDPNKGLTKDIPPHPQWADGFAVGFAWGWKDAMAKAGSLDPGDE